MDSTTGVSGCRVALEATRWREWSWWHRSAVPEASTPPAASKKPLHCAQVTYVEIKVAQPSAFGHSQVSGGFFQCQPCASGCLELRPASANQPLGPHWPAMQASLSTSCSTVSSRRASGWLVSSSAAAVVKRARRLAAVQGKAQTGE